MFFCHSPALCRCDIRPGLFGVDISRKTAALCTLCICARPFFLSAFRTYKRRCIPFRSNRLDAGNFRRPVRHRFRYRNYRPPFRRQRKPRTRPSFAETLFCIVNFACASFYEEALYRLYLPESIRAILEDLLPKRINKSENENTLQKKNAVNEHGSRNIFLISEISAVSLFALSHRYLGLPAVANAFFAGIVLRICCKKSKTLWTNTVSHFAYNMLSLVLFALIR